MDRYDLDGYGFATATVSGLPAGVGYKVVYSNSYSYVQFYGSPVQAGVYNVTIVTDDELGNRMTETVTWLVYNDFMQPQHRLTWCMALHRAFISVSM